MQSSCEVALCLETSVMYMCSPCDLQLLLAQAKSSKQASSAESSGHDHQSRAQPRPHAASGRHHPQQQAQTRQSQYQCWSEGPQPAANAWIYMQSSRTAQGHSTAVEKPHSQAASSTSKVCNMCILQIPECSTQICHAIAASYCKLDSIQLQAFQMH